MAEEASPTRRSGRKGEPRQSGEALSGTASCPFAELRQSRENKVVQTSRGRGFGFARFACSPSYSGHTQFPTQYLSKARQRLALTALTGALRRTLYLRLAHTLRKACSTCPTVGAKIKKSTFSIFRRCRLFSCRIKNNML